MAKRRTMPSSVTPHVGWFDRFAAAASAHVSRAWFFAACVGLIVLWVPSYPLWGSGDVYQLIVNTITTCVTFLLVALLQNSQSRADQATQHKLNAIAAGLAALMDNDAGTADTDQLGEALEELRAAVGLEERESSA